MSILKKTIACLCAVLTVLPVIGCGGGGTVTTDAVTTDAPAAPTQAPVITDAPEPEKENITRAQMEQALVSTAFAYFVKGTKIQYDSTTIHEALGIYYDGPARIDEHGTPEEATSTYTLYSVCADFVYKVYEEGLGYRLYGAVNHADARTQAMWWFAQKQPDKIRGDVPSKDILLARYLNTAKYPDFTSEDKSYGLHKTEGVDMDYDTFSKYMNDYKSHLRAGDVIVAGHDGEGHAMMYCGNGYMMECSGSNIDVSTGKESIESTGTLNLLTFEDFFLNGTRKGFWISKSNTNPRDWYIIIRPLDLICIDDGNGNPDDDKAIDAYGQLPERTLTRLANTNLDIDRTASTGQYGSAVKDGQITYTVLITNRSSNRQFKRFMTVSDPSYAGCDYKDLEITETVPEGTELVEGSITEGGKAENGKITWKTDVKPGESKTLSYTVKVIADAGSTIVNDGGTVGNIASNVLRCEVGYGTPAVLTKEYLSSLPRVSDLLSAIFEMKKDKYAPISVQRSEVKEQNLPVIRADRSKIPENMQKYYDMLVDLYVGGRKYYAPEGDYVTNLTTSHLEVGDIIVCAQMLSSGSANAKTSYIYMYLGADRFYKLDSFGDITETNSAEALNRLFSYSIFFCLRQSHVR